MSETPVRSFAKAISWRVVATLTTMTLVFAFTRHLSLAVGVGALEVICKLLFYYAHERVWNLIRWGKAANKEKPPRERPSVGETFEEIPEVQRGVVDVPEIPKWVAREGTASAPWSE